MVIDDNFYMSLAVKEAWKYQILTYPNPAVGAVVVSGCGKILSVEAHKKAGFAHAEVLALQSAFSILKQDKEILKLQNSHDIHKYLLKNHDGCFSGCEIYTTLEPCSHVGKTPSCANLIKNLGLKKVYIGSLDFLHGGGADMLRDSGIEVICDVLKKECDDLLLPFYTWQKKGNFVFFKWATRLNGSIDGNITCKDSKKHVHALRDVCDLLVIGGNTVRVDRPRLDARFVSGKAPDVLIYSKQKEFDKTIPLFNVEGREVFISDNLDMIKNYKCVMIEGVENMLEATKEITDLHLCYVSLGIQNSTNIKNIDTNFELLHADGIQNDIILWLKRK